MSHSVDERYAVYSEPVRKARKTHVCDGCLRDIRPGDYYAAVTWIFDGSAEHAKRCGACQTTHKHLRKLGGGDMWPDEELNCGLDYEDEWSGKPPDDIAALPFLSDDDAGRLLAPSTDRGQP